MCLIPVITINLLGAGKSPSSFLFDIRSLPCPCGQVRLGILWIFLLVAVLIGIKTHEIYS